MIVSHKHKYIFIHNDKAAGTAIRQHFRRHAAAFAPDFMGNWGRSVTKELWDEHSHIMNGFLNQHAEPATIKAYFDMMGWNWDEYFKFGIVRNTFDRIVSGYEWRRSVVATSIKDPHNKGNIPNLKDIVAETDNGFKNFVINKSQIWNSQLRYFYSKQIKDWEHPSEKDCVVDFIGRYENLEHDFKHIIKTILPNASDELLILRKRNHSVRKKDYRSYYNDETRKIVEENLSYELEFLGYEY